ncbi:hypothetical protein [Agromyces albus]|uniref:hypothetical protein n=1 Tax=Agromyces albus TaxID=205332 RepID=UPI001F529201|nr:hypothetical protein [Agromyces albus]
MPQPRVALGAVGVRPARPAAATLVAVSTKVLVARVLIARVSMPGTGAIAMPARVPGPVLDRLGAALQPTPALIAAHRDEGGFDDGYRIVVVGRVIRL